MGALSRFLMLMASEVRLAVATFNPCPCRVHGSWESDAHVAPQVGIRPMPWHYVEIRLGNLYTAVLTRR